MYTIYGGKSRILSLVTFKRYGRAHAECFICLGIVCRAYTETSIFVIQNDISVIKSRTFKWNTEALKEIMYEYILFIYLRKTMIFIHSSLFGHYFHNVAYLISNFCITKAQSRIRRTRFSIT